MKLDDINFGTLGTFVGGMVIGIIVFEDVNKDVEQVKIDVERLRSEFTRKEIVELELEAIKQDIAELKIKLNEDK